MILPGATLGVLGGGQLGRMFTLRARTMGYRVVVLDPDPESPAGQIADRHIRAAYEDERALGELAECDAVTTEFENVPAAALERLSASTRVCPGARPVAIAQDRIAEKTFLRESRIPHRSVSGGQAAPPTWTLRSPLFRSLPCSRRAASDTTARAKPTILDPADAADAFERFGNVACVLEERLTSRPSSPWFWREAQDGAGGRLPTRRESPPRWDPGDDGGARRGWHRHWRARLERLRGEWPKLWSTSA